MNIVFYGEKYHEESGGAFGMYYDELTGAPVTFHDIGMALATADKVHIRPATVADTYKMDAALAIYKAQQAAATTEQANLMRGIETTLANLFGGNNAN